MHQAISNEVGPISVAGHDVWLDEDVFEKDREGDELQSRVARHTARLSVV